MFWDYINDHIIRNMDNEDIAFYNAEEYDYRMKPSIVLLLLHKLGFITIKEELVPKGKITQEVLDKLETLLDPINSANLPIKNNPLNKISDPKQSLNFLYIATGLAAGAAIGGATFGIMYALKQIQDISGISSTALTSFCGLETNLPIAALASIIVVSATVVGALVAASIDAYNIYQVRHYL